MESSRHLTLSAALKLALDLFQQALQLCRHEFGVIFLDKMTTTRCDDHAGSPLRITELEQAFVVPMPRTDKVEGRISR